MYFSSYCLTYSLCFSFFFFFNDTATSEIYTLSLHDALPILFVPAQARKPTPSATTANKETSFRMRAILSGNLSRSEEHTSELQSLRHLVCRLLLEKKKLPLS